jgi:hypothetical protein
LEDDKTIVPEINSTLAAGAFNYYAYNSQIQLYMNSTQTMLNKPATGVVLNNMKYLFILGDIFHEEHTRNTDIHTEVYRANWNEIMMFVPCIKESDQTKTSPPSLLCSSTGSPQSGKETSFELGFFYNHLRVNLDKYVKYSSSTTLPWAGTGTACPALSNNFCSKEKSCIHSTSQE